MKKLIIVLFSIIAISAAAAINPNTRPKSSGNYYSEQHRILDSRNYYTSENTTNSNGIVVSLESNSPITGSLVEYNYNYGIQSIKNFMTVSCINFPLSSSIIAPAFLKIIKETRIETADNTILAFTEYQ